MKLPLIEHDARFSCGGCTACCDQPWRTLIEADKAHALDHHDWRAHPQLAGKRFYQSPADGRTGYYDLAKGEGTKCLFLDTDGRCIIHKELGPEAKPGMCRQFPFLPSRTWTDDRISLNYGCPTVQRNHGERLTSQQDDIIATTTMASRPYKGAEVPVPLDTTATVSHEQYEMILNHALDLFSEDREGDIWSRFEQLIEHLVNVRAGAESQSQSADEASPVDRSRLNGESPAAPPMPARMLFAATLYPDTLPADQTGRIGFFRRLTLMPRLMSLAKLSGGYASRTLGRNVSIDAVMRYPAPDGIDPAATRLLLRYFRSRFWQRLLVGTRLPILGGVHQHICDLNAIMFFSRAEAQHETQSGHPACRSVLSEGLVRKGLTGVEFHLANQSRLYEQVLRGWLRAQLCDAAMAMRSLRIFAPRVTSSPR